MANKIIGLSCSTKHGRGEALLRAAAMGAAEVGMQTEIIRAMDLKVLPCRGCHTCERTGKCVLKDDVEWILEKTVVEDAGLIVSVPCYHIRANGYLTAISERMNPVFIRNMDSLNKTRVGAVIGTGGSGYDGWASLNLVMANIFVQHTRVLVDQMQMNNCGLKEWNLWQQKEDGSLTSHTQQARIQDLEYERIWELWPQEYDMVDFAKSGLERAKELGRNVARAMMMPIEEVRYVGETASVACPVCHCNVLLVPENLPHVMCPICAVRGTVSTDGGQMQVEWNQEDSEYPRFSREAVEHHFYWLTQHFRQHGGLEALGEVEELWEDVRSYGTLIRPGESPH